MILRNYARLRPCYGAAMSVRSIALSLVASLFGLAPGIAAANCQCLANGRAYPRGGIACIAPPGAHYLARCDIELNNTSWKKLRDGCPMTTENKTDGLPALNAIPAGTSHSNWTPSTDRPKGAASSPSLPEIADHC